MPYSVLNWNPDASLDTPTWFRAYLASPFRFEELVARLITLSGQDPTLNTDEYKVSVQFEGFFNFEPFTLYDYKEDREIHIGGSDKLDVEGLQKALDEALRAVEPTAYQADEFYDLEVGHGWPV